jgi:hypothetical protein
MMNERVDEIEGVMQPIDDGALRAYLDGDPALDDAARARIAAVLGVTAVLFELVSRGQLSWRHRDAEDVASGHIFAEFGKLEVDGHDC